MPRLSFSPRHSGGTCPRAVCSGAARALPSRGWARPSRTAIPAGAGLRSREHAGISAHVAPLQRREDTRGTRTPPHPTHPHTPTHTRALPEPCVPDGRGEGSGVHTDTAPLVFHQCQIWEIAGFSPLTSVPEAQRGGEAAVLLHGEAGAGRGDPATPAELGGPRPGGVGRGGSLPPGAAGALMGEVLRAAWGELNFHLHVKRYRCQ